MRYFEYFKLDSEPKDLSKVVYLVTFTAGTGRGILGIYSTKEKAIEAISLDDCSWVNYFINQMEIE